MAVWVFVEINKVKHKFFGLFLILLILFIYVSGASIFNANEIDLTTGKGVIEAGKVYLSWLGSILVNLKNITADAINLDWSQNSTTEDKGK